MGPGETTLSWMHTWGGRCRAVPNTDPVPCHVPNRVVLGWYAPGPGVYFLLNGFSVYGTCFPDGEGCSVRAAPRLGPADMQRLRPAAAPACSPGETGAEESGGSRPGRRRALPRRWFTGSTSSCVAACRRASCVAYTDSVIARGLPGEGASAWRDVEVRSRGEPGPGLRPELLELAAAAGGWAGRWGQRVGAAARGQVGGRAGGQAGWWAVGRAVGQAGGQGKTG